MKRMHTSDDLISRREFNRIVTLGGTGALLPASAAAEMEKAATDPEGSAEMPAEEEGLSAAEQSEVKAKYEAVLRKWGTRLSDDERKRVRQVIVSHQRLLQPVRAFVVENSDAPAPVLRFVTDRAEAAYLSRVADHKDGD